MPVSVTYCTQAEMERKFSVVGVTSFSDHDNDGTNDIGVVDDAIDWASEEINLYAYQHYSTSGLSGSTLVNRWCVTLACVFLCGNRGNPVPESLQAEFERILAQLERVRTGELILPGIPYRDDTRPTISNLEIDRRYRFNRPRVASDSSTQAPSKVGQNKVEIGGSVYLP